MKVLERKIYEGENIVGEIFQNKHLDGWDVYDTKGNHAGTVIVLGGGHFGIVNHGHPNSYMRDQTGHNLANAVLRCFFRRRNMGY